MRAGDTVRHGPTGETWIVAYVAGDYLAWCGWPEGEARVADCSLLRACSDAEHEAALREWAEGDHRRDGGGSDRRQIVCRRQLAELVARKAAS